MDTCVFCAIVNGQAPASIVYEDEHTLAIMDIAQPNPYKVLVLSKAHRETIYDLDDELAAAVFQTTVRVARAIRQVSGCTGLNVMQANGPVAGQEVFHFHLHLVPRHQGDSIRFSWRLNYPERETLDGYATALRQALDLAPPDPTST